MYAALVGYPACIEQVALSCQDDVPNSESEHLSLLIKDDRLSRAELLGGFAGPLLVIGTVLHIHQRGVSFNYEVTLKWSKPKPETYTSLKNNPFVCCFTQNLSLKGGSCKAYLAPGFM